MSQQDGGPAFPCSVRRTEKYMDEGGYGRERTVSVQEGGMTLRDYFAAHAPRAPADWFDIQYDGTPENYIELSVRWQWIYADAMLAAREGAR